MIARLAYTASLPIPAPRSIIVDNTDSCAALARTHDGVLIRNTGWALDPERWATSCARCEALDAQTERLAALLEEAGIPARQDSDVVAIGAVTGIVDAVSVWRPIRFLPSVAARDRRPMLNGLRYWIERVHPRSRYLRYGVVTHGDLVRAHGDLRGSLQRLARDVSKWACEARALYDIEVHFRGSEFTRATASERHAAAVAAGRAFDLASYPDDPVLYHVHANILLEPTRLLPKEGAGSWAEFLSWTHGYFGAHWKDSGRIKDVRELVKYVVKPGDLLDGRRPLDAGEAKWLHESLFRLNLAQPLGSFRTYWRELTEARKKVVVVKAQDGKPRLREIEKARRLDHSRHRADVVETDGIVAQGRGVPENTILGVTLPQWRHTPWAEPVILVQGYQPRTYGKASRERLLEIEWEQSVARQAWDKAGAPEPSVALQVAQAWQEKGATSNVTPFRGRDAGAAEAARPYMVHTSSVAVLNHMHGRRRDPPPTPPPTPPPDPPDRSGQRLGIPNSSRSEDHRQDFIDIREAHEGTEPWRHLRYA